MDLIQPNILITFQKYLTLEDNCKLIVDIDGQFFKSMHVVKAF